ncbi:MAG: hypothetical protein HOP09_14550 [Hyphomicrobium sp.]|nr:hypothetical protein [Hyphomicrobium sp.]
MNRNHITTRELLRQERAVYHAYHTLVARGYSLNLELEDLPEPVVTWPDLTVHRVTDDAGDEWLYLVGYTGTHEVHDIVRVGDVGVEVG